MNIDIRPIDDDLIGACAEMMANANPWNSLYFSGEQCVACLDQSSIRLDGAFRDSELVGFLASMAEGLAGEPLLEYLCVDESVRGSGIGTALIGFFETVLFPDADNLYLFVSDINPSAKRLYTRLGYEQVGAFPDFNLEMQTEFLHRKSRRPRQAVRQERALKDDL